MQITTHTSPTVERAFTLELSEAELTRLVRLAYLHEGGNEHPQSQGQQGTLRFHEIVADALGGSDPVLQRASLVLPDFGTGWNR